MVYIENDLIDSDGSMYLTDDLLIETNNIITGSNNITLRKVNVKPYGFDKMYMDKEIIEDKLYQMIVISMKTEHIYKNTIKQNTFIL